MGFLTKVFSIIVIVVLIIAFVMAAPQSTTECHDEQLNLTIKPGEVAYPEGKCLRVVCSNEGKMRIDPCEFAIGPKCRVVKGDLSQQYPGCCPKVECD